MAIIKRNITATPGLQPSTDSTTTSTTHFVDADKIRFRDGFPEKIGGYVQVLIDNDDPINGCIRTVYSYNLENNVRYILGGDTYLYYLFASQLVNITPLDTATTAIPNSLNSNYGLLVNDALITISGSTTITVNDPATIIHAGDVIELSGIVGFNGVPAAELNTAHRVVTVDENSYEFIVTTAATSTGSGGGATITQATSIITVDQPVHDFVNGERIKINGAVSFAGIPDVAINKEHIIRNVTTNTYDIVVATIATSSVTNGGGAATNVQGQIPQGLCDATAAQGYGAGLYGIGLYGVSKISEQGEIDARSWILDRYGNSVVMNPGVQTGVYIWDSNPEEAPILLQNAPTEVNYVFVSNEIVVTLGASGVGNRIQWSDQGNPTEWTALATNQAGQDDIEQASTFISHINLKRINLLFTSSQVFTYRYIGRPFVWETRLLDEKSGIISKNARVQHNGVAYWMGTDNFYYYRSGNVEIIPSNTTSETTIKKYVFDNITTSQTSKIFAWYNRNFNEVWWHYPSAGSLECDKVVRLNVKDFTWTFDTFDRSAGEYPTQLQEFPFVAQAFRDESYSVIYEHENGTDANGEPLSWYIKTPFYDTGLDTANFLTIEPDSLQNGSINCTIDVKKYPQSTQIYGSRSFDVEPDTEVVSYRLDNRYVQYTLTGSSLGQFWRSGIWKETVSKSGGR